MPSIAASGSQDVAEGEITGMPMGQSYPLDSSATLPPRAPTAEDSALGDEGQRGGGECWDFIALHWGPLLTNYLHPHPAGIPMSAVALVTSQQRKETPPLSKLQMAVPLDQHSIHCLWCDTIHHLVPAATLHPYQSQHPDPAAPSTSLQRCWLELLLLCDFQTRRDLNRNSVNYMKPVIITFYNCTKSGVDTPDQHCATSVVSRKTRHWHMVVLFAMLNIAGLSSQIIYIGNGNPDLGSKRHCSRQLAVHLVETHMTR
ncbi:hypothetical protein PR048_018642 [Dryococelus australis]|uniref:Uncharacterized protein n=1 Tax=Dryococelus australis TaxID=614101 RepID=A0ABQ9HD13_9NEOP|nr:hypothetical protein PR048_018642 [Dryococelus australis]